MAVFRVQRVGARILMPAFESRGEVRKILTQCVDALARGVRELPLRVFRIGSYWPQWLHRETIPLRVGHCQPNTNWVDSPPYGKTKKDCDVPSSLSTIALPVLPRRQGRQRILSEKEPGESTQGQESRAGEMEENAEPGDIDAGLRRRVHVGSSRAVLRTAGRVQMFVS